MKTIEVIPWTATSSPIGTVPPFTKVTVWTDESTSFTLDACCIDWSDRRKPQIVAYAVLPPEIFGKPKRYKVLRSNDTYPHFRVYDRKSYKSVCTLDPEYGEFANRICDMFNAERK